jgi:anaerobic magnesium-protoporphyrin IX monomethyl ester cyclase
MVGVNAVGYRSLALDYLHAAAAADPRLDIAFHRFDTDVTADPWWTAYRVLRLDPAPQVVAMPVLCWTAPHVYKVAALVKAALPETRVVLGGPEVGPIAGQVLEEDPAVDAVVRGEGEIAFADVLHSYARGGDPAGIAGVTARSGSRIVEGPEREPIADLDSLPSPYPATGSRTDGSAYVETYRGCPHRCAYCYEGKGSTKIRSFGWDRIESDIRTVAGTPGMRSFSFIDPVFNLTDERLHRLSDILAPYAEKGMRLHTIEVNIERIGPEEARLLARAGVASVETGPQTVGKAALEACLRGFDEDRFRAGVTACREAGISVECDVIIGLPGDTADDVMAGIDFATSLDPGRVQVSTLHVLPGTALWDGADQAGLVFDRRPPHEVVATRDLSFADLRRLEVYGNACARAYGARLSIR